MYPRFWILLTKDTSVFEYWVFLCLSEARLFVGLKDDGKVMGLMIHR
jgi:hypothetical protein